MKFNALLLLSLFPIIMYTAEQQLALQQGAQTAKPDNTIWEELNAMLAELDAATQSLPKAPETDQPSVQQTLKQLQEKYSSLEQRVDRHLAMTSGTKNDTEKPEPIPVALPVAHSLKVVEVATDYIIYCDRITGQQTFSLRLNWLPDGNDTPYPPYQEAMGYLTAVKTKTGKTYAQITQEQADDWRITTQNASLKELNKLVQATQHNIAHFRSKYNTLLGLVGTPAGLHYAQKRRCEELAELEATPKLRPNPLLLQVLLHQQSKAQLRRMKEEQEGKIADTHL